MSDCRKCADFEWCVKNEDCGLFKAKPETNADRIRNMTDEKLAIVFSDHASCELCPAIQEKCGYGNGCQEAWLKWLKQECEE